MIFMLRRFDYFEILLFLICRLIPRFHRVKAISLILAATLLVASLHHLIVSFSLFQENSQYFAWARDLSERVNGVCELNWSFTLYFQIKFDNTNGCAEFGIVECNFTNFEFPESVFSAKYAILAAIFNVIYFGLVTCNLILVRSEDRQTNLFIFPFQMLVHFMETAPSSLRMTCFMIVYFPYVCFFSFASFLSWHHTIHGHGMASLIHGMAWFMAWHHWFISWHHWFMAGLWKRL